MGDEDASYHSEDKYDTDPYFRQTALEFALRLHRAGEELVTSPTAIVDTARLFYNFITNKNS